MNKNLKEEAMKTAAVLMKITIGICLFILFQSTKAQLKNASNMDSFLDTINVNGIEKIEQVSTKVMVNSKMIEKFYDYSTTPHYAIFSWNELLYAYRNNEERFLAFWKSYQNVQAGNNKPSEIDKELRKNLKMAKQKDISGYNAYEPGEIKLNLEMIEQFYNSDSYSDYVTLNEILFSYINDRENLMAHWTSFKVSDEGFMTFAEKD